MLRVLAALAWVMLVLALVIVPPVRQWANDNVGAMTAVAGLLAAWLGWLTREMVQQASEQVTVTQELRFDATLPVVTFVMEPGGNLERFAVKLRNVGPGPARRRRPSPGRRKFSSSPSRQKSHSS